MRFCCALVAVLLAGGSIEQHARADDPRAVFGLGKPAPAPASCSDGLAFDCAMATDPLDEATPYGLSTWLPAGYLLRLPVADATHASVASYALGGGTDAAGPVFGGATGLENRWTIEGAPADSLRTGGVDTQVPLTFLAGIYAMAGGFSARDRASTGGTIDARLVKGGANHEIFVDAWTTLTATARQQPIADDTYSLRHRAIDQGPQATLSLVATGPVASLSELLGGKAWYAVGIAPSLSERDVAWQASRLVDLNNDGQPDGLPGSVVLAPIERTEARPIDYTVPAMARLGIDGSVHHFDLTLIGQVQRSESFLINSTLQAAGVSARTSTGDAIATWRGTWADTRARVQLAWHASSQVESAYDPAAASIPQLGTTYIPPQLIDDPVLAAACDDAAASDPAKLIPNCPVPFGFFASGGAGELTNITASRPSATADLAHRFGRHVVRIGGTVEDSDLVTTSSFTANEEDFSLFPGEQSVRRFYLGSCSDTGTCNYASASQLGYRALYAAAYAEDTYAPLPGLSIDAGLRWELMWVGPRLHFSRELSPRFGVVWDPIGGGRSRLWASAGRSFLMLPPGIGPTVIQRPTTVDDFTFPGGTSRTHDAGSAFRIVPGIEPTELDELTIGGEIALAGSLRLTAWGQGQRLRNGIETTPEGFDNPGRNGEIAAFRETEIAALAVEMRQPQTAVRIGVMWGRTVGTWVGPFDPRFGANLLASPDWDVDPSNLYGPLPTDPGGRGFLEAERRIALGSVGLAFATRLSVASGRPRNVLADGPDGVTELLPRGGGGRDPVIAEADVRLAASWRGFTATLDILNLFDRRDVTNLDELYSVDAVHPIQGGTPQDLVFLKSDSGQAATRQTAFQVPSVFQPPLSVTLGIHKAF